MTIHNFREPAWLTYHLVPAEEWEAARDRPYLPAAFAWEGFIHTTHAAREVAAAGNRYYASDPRPYLAVMIDLRRLASPWRYDGDERFPHIYGPLNRDAVIAVQPAPRAPDGAFLPPTWAGPVYPPEDIPFTARRDRMAEFSMVRTIERTRQGEPLGAETVEALVSGFTRGDIPDYQTAAWLMAVLWRGLAPDDLTALTLAMARSGDTLDLSPLGRPVADKHSTGGVGDKTTLVVAPVVAACGVPMAKMSGRGLGHTGGTIDKLESIPGFNPELTVARFMDVLRQCDLVLAGQSVDLAPADGKLYALRDVTGTVPSIPLIASSIMAKKLAVGADAILLDVKVGRGAFMETMAEATDLARIMVQIGEGAGKHTVAVISDMDRPLGRAVGNALEVIEAIETLRGNGPDDLRTLALHEAALLLVMTGTATDEAAATRMAAEAIRSGAAFAAFAAVVAAQGGDRRAVEDPSRLPRAPVVVTVPSPRSGIIAAIEPLAIGHAAMRLGAGRERKDDTIDAAVGIVLHATVGDRVAAGAPLFDIHARDEARATAVRADALAAFTFSDTPVAVPPLIKATITAPYVNRVPRIRR